MVTPKSKFYIDAYKVGSKSAKALSEATDIRRITGKHVKKPWHFYLPWGRGLNKLEQLNALAVVARVPTWTTNRIQAEIWVEKGKDVMARTLLNSSCGKGIVFCTRNNVPEAPLYTLYIKKAREFRVHYFKGQFIHLQEKKLKEGGTHSKIRNHDNGYVFCTLELGEIPPDVYLQAQEAARRITPRGFGAVDIIYNELQGSAYVLEVNSAPGLEGKTLEVYIEQVKLWQESCLRDAAIMKAAKVAMPEPTIATGDIFATPVGEGVRVTEGLPDIQEIPRNTLLNTPTYHEYRPFEYAAPPTMEEVRQQRARPVTNAYREQQRRKRAAEMKRYMDIVRNYETRTR